MRQPALGILGTFGPRIAEIDVDALHTILRREHLSDILDVVARNHHILYRFIAECFGDIAARIAQHIAGNVDCNEIRIPVVIHHRSGRNALAAAQLQMQRLILCKQLAPMTAVFLRLIGKIRADSQFRLRPLLGAHMHGNRSSTKRASHA